MPTENASEIEERDSELENTVGIISVAEYQTNGTRNKLAHKIFIVKLSIVAFCLLTFSNRRLDRTVISNQ
jgi:hypothetical protein